MQMCDDELPVFSFPRILLPGRISVRVFCYDRRINLSFTLAPFQISFALAFSLSEGDLEITNTRAGRQMFPVFSEALHSQRAPL